MVKRAFLLLLLLCVVGLASAFFPSVQADTTNTLTFLASSSDGYAYGTLGPVYGTVRNASTGTVSAEQNYFYVGQYLSGGNYMVERGYLFFDTAGIPDSATIDSAVLSLYVTNNYTARVFNVTIESGGATYPHDPLQTTDYYHSLYTTGGGTRNVTGIGAAGYWNITMSATGLAWVSLSGTSKFALKSNYDIENSEPTGVERIFFASAEAGTSYAARLYVTYTVPTGSEYGFTFYGPFNEETGLALYPGENVTVSVWSSEGGAYDSFTLNDSYVYNATSQIQFFQFTFDDNTTREYWLDASELSTATIYVFKAASTSYVINFLDTAGVLDTYPYVTAERYINGSLCTVEKRKVDVYNSVLMNLIAGRTYTIRIGNAAESYVFGELLMTGTTAVQLTLRAVDFPTETLLQQKYVRVYSYRNASTNIIIVFEDTKQMTESVAISIKYADLTEAFSTTLYSQSFSYTWASALANTTYQVTVTVQHETYGVLTFRQLITESISGSAPFSLAWLGTWAFDSSFLLPAAIILFTAGCFSTLNAEAGMILMCIVAVILAWLGWIPISVGALVSAFTLSILAALVASKRRIQY